jgi:hypothetical protein
VYLNIGILKEKYMTLTLKVKTVCKLVILSVPPETKAKYILTTMNEELLAASALLVQDGTLLVSHNGFINFFAIVQY